MEIATSSDGVANVKHTVVRSGTPQHLDLIKGTPTNITVTDEDGQVKAYEMVGDGRILLLPSTTNLIVEYKLKDAIIKDREYWSWEFHYQMTTKFSFPDDVQVVYLNGRSIHMDESDGVVCHGCQITLEYSLGEKSIVKYATWEDRRFDVEIITHLMVEDFVFEQPTKSISVDVSTADQYLTIVMPLELLGEPYSVFLNEERLFAQIDHRNDTHVWVHMKPSEPGEIVMVGTTVIPEFSMMIPLVVGFMIILMIPLARRITLH